MRTPIALSLALCLSLFPSFASAEEAARQIARKYDLGAATVTDYNAAVSAQVKARSQLLQAKYEYLFKIKTLTYYTNCCHGE